LGKWALRYLFSNLIDEEIRRDEEYRKTPGSQRFRNESAVAHIQILTDPAGSTVATPLTKSSNGGYSLFPQTPNLGIGLATPVGLNNLNTPFTPWEDNQARTSIDGQGGDYFTAGGNFNGARKSAEASDDGRGTPMPDKDKEEKDSSLFGKWRPFGTKKLGRSASTDMGGLKTVAHATEDKVGERTAAGESAEQPDQLDETLAGVIRNIRKTYDALHRDDSSVPPNSLITPSLPSETPVLKLPKNTTIIVQEDKPDSGGVADLYRGTVGCVGRDADLLEKVAPAWLGELILLNRIPFKDTIKVSFVLVPWDDSLPFLPSESGRYLLPWMSLFNITEQLTRPVARVNTPA
jgi:WD repeat-containing protein 48